MSAVGVVISVVVGVDVGVGLVKLEEGLVEVGLMAVDVDDGENFVCEVVTWTEDMDSNIVASGVEVATGSMVVEVGWETAMLVGFAEELVVVAMRLELAWLAMRLEAAKRSEVTWLDMRSEVVCTSAVDDDGIGFTVELMGGMAVDDISMTKEVVDGRVLDDIGTIMPGEN